MKPREVENDLALASFSGLVATIPMTAVMEILRYALMHSRAGSFPPRQVAQGMLKQTALHENPQSLGEPALFAITTLTHFGFGAVAGALFGVTGFAAQRRSVPIRGAMFGLVVWTTSYFGWMPAMGLLKPQADYPVRKGIILAGSHLVWGAVTALTFDWLRRRDRQSTGVASRTHQRIYLATPTGS